MTESTCRIIDAIRSVSPGRVSCYRDIARVAGLPNGARQVARVLHSLTEKYDLPWHRIVRADGTIALDSCRGGDLQAEMLRSEGVAVSENGSVDMSRYGRLSNDGTTGVSIVPEGGIVTQRQYRRLR